MPLFVPCQGLMNSCMYKYFHRTWSLWILVIIFMNIFVFVNVIRNQGAVYLNNNDRIIQDLDAKIQKLVDEVHNEVQEHKSFMKNLADLLDKISPENNNKIATQNLFTSWKEKHLNHCSDNVIAVLIITCNRSSGLERTLKQIIKYRSQLDSKANLFPIFISQGCNDQPTKDIVDKYRANISGTLFYHQKDDELMKKVKVKRMFGYFKISDHYQNAIDWVLGLGNQTYEYTVYSNIKFNELGSLLIVEDDLDIAPDFFSYFRATNFILRNDKKLFCVSAWNDNGKKNLVNQSANEQLYRTDFFPGLGWMMLRSFWEEIREKWPDSFWDEYIRQPEIRKDRQCIRPEIPRTATFGRKGVSNGQFFDKHLKFLLLNDKPVDFCKANLSYIMTKEIYDSLWLKEVYNDSVSVSLTDFLSSKSEKLPKKIRIEYSVNNEFSAYAKKLSLMDDVKSGVPRTAYLGVVTFMRDNLRVFLSPKLNWTHYTLS